MMWVTPNLSRAGPFLMVGITENILYKKKATGPKIANIQNQILLFPGSLGLVPPSYLIRLEITAASKIATPIKISAKIYVEVTNADTCLRPTPLADAILAINKKIRDKEIVFFICFSFYK